MVAEDGSIIKWVVKQTVDNEVRAIYYYGEQTTEAVARANVADLQRLNTKSTFELTGY
jgi:hypothetical protein